MTSDVVQIRDLEFAYEATTPVLRIEALDIKKLEKIFIFGPSGSGKTTLLGLLAGVLRARSGSVKILGRDLATMSASERDHFRGTHLGYIFQMFNLIPYLTAMDNITLSCRLNPERQAKLGGGKVGESNINELALRLASDLGISDILNKKATALSVGEQQRVAVARALLGAPELIIADEPTSALDSDHREKFLDLLFAEAKANDSTVLFVSHDRSLEKYFDRSVSLQEINRR